MNVPASIADWVPQRFADEDVPLYGQAATVGDDGAPNVRTVHYRYVAPADALGFACHTESPKWRELTARPRLAGCYFTPKRQIQLRWRAVCRLLSDPAAAEARFLWRRTQEWLRGEYWQGQGKRDDVCPRFGVVLLEIDYWDVYHIDLADPSKSRRACFTIEKGVWRERVKHTLR